MDVGMRLITTEPGSTAVDTSERFTQVVVDEGTLAPNVNDLRLQELQVHDRAEAAAGWPDPGRDADLRAPGRGRSAHQLTAHVIADGQNGRSRDGQRRAPFSPLDQRHGAIPGPRSTIDKSSRAALSAPRLQFVSHPSTREELPMTTLDRRRFIETQHVARDRRLRRPSRRARRAAQPFAADATAEQVTEGIDLTGKTIVVTGCNSGIGLETMRVLALRGAHVDRHGAHARARPRGMRERRRARRRPSCSSSATSIPSSRAPRRFARSIRRSMHSSAMPACC